jgi:hypothetical protein
MARLRFTAVVGCSLRVPRETSGCTSCSPLLPIHGLSSLVVSSTYCCFQVRHIGRAQRAVRIPIRQHAKDLHGPNPDGNRVSSLQRRLVDQLLTWNPLLPDTINPTPTLLCPSHLSNPCTTLTSQNPAQGKKVAALMDGVSALWTRRISLSMVLGSTHSLSIMTPVSTLQHIFSRFFFSFSDVSHNEPLENSNH